jgi:hypothetical protein
MGKVTATVRVADEVWIATALLHRENPRAIDFTLKEIEARVAQEGLTAGNRPGVYTHVAVHCVGNRAPDKGRYRILLETGPSRRRLFRPGDPYHPGREGGKVVPERSEIPSKYHALLDWYEERWSPAREKDPLAALAAKYRDLWRGVNPDDYVRRLREGFE